MIKCVLGLLFNLVQWQTRKENGEQKVCFREERNPQTQLCIITSLHPKALQEQQLRLSSNWSRRETSPKYSVTKDSSWEHGGWCTQARTEKKRTARWRRDTSTNEPQARSRLLTEEKPLKGFLREHSHFQQTYEKTIRISFSKDHLSCYNNPHIQSSSQTKQWNKINTCVTFKWQQSTNAMGIQSVSVNLNWKIISISWCHLVIYK